jgi:uncharacterized protein YbjT (DUF2867 family)
VNVAIAGAHGQIALRLARLLDAESDRVIGLIRNPDHAAEVSQAGAVPVRCDLERASVEEIATAIQGADAVVFAAGAGPGSEAGRKLTMDRDGAIKLLRAATKHRITVLMCMDLSRVLTETVWEARGRGHALRLVVQEGCHGVVEFLPPRGVVDRRDGSGAG